MNWLKKAAPYLVTALTGNVPALAAMAAKDMAAVIGSNPTIQDVQDALAEGVDPERLLFLKQVDKDFQIRMKELGYANIEELERIAHADRESARAREIALDDWVPKALAMLVSIGFFSVLWFMITHGVPDYGGEALLVLLGSLGTAWTSIVAYYFGSSVGSTMKTKIMGSTNKSP